LRFDLRRIAARGILGGRLAGGVRQTSQEHEQDGCETRPRATFRLKA
jgi:hypothetical protein